MVNKELIQLLNKELALEIAEKHTYDEVHSALAAYINGLIKYDFEKLISYLYRIDVNEQKLKNLLQQNPQEDTGDVIATLIIERQQQKITLRDQFGKHENNLPAGLAGYDEEEKW